MALQNGKVRLRCYKGGVYVTSRESDTEKLYSAEESSMDSLVDFSPVDTSRWRTRRSAMGIG